MTKTISAQVYWITGSVPENTGLSDDDVERHKQRPALPHIGGFPAQRSLARRLRIVAPAASLLHLVLGYILNRGNIVRRDIIRLAEVA